MVDLYSPVMISCTMWSNYILRIKAEIITGKIFIRFLGCTMCLRPKCTIIPGKHPREWPSGHQLKASTLPGSFTTQSYILSTFTFYSSDLCTNDILSWLQRNYHIGMWLGADSGVSLNLHRPSPETAVWPWQGTPPLCASVPSYVTRGSNSSHLHRRSPGISGTTPGTW